MRWRWRRSEEMRQSSVSSVPGPLLSPVVHLIMAAGQNPPRSDVRRTLVVRCKKLASCQAPLPFSGGVRKRLGRTVIFPLIFDFALVACGTVLVRPASPCPCQPGAAGWG